LTPAPANTSSALSGSADAFAAAVTEHAADLLWGHVQRWGPSRSRETIIKSEGRCLLEDSELDQGWLGECLLNTIQHHRVRFKQEDLLLGAVSLTAVDVAVRSLLDGMDRCLVGRDRLAGKRREMLARDLGPSPSRVTVQGSRLATRGVLRLRGHLPAVVDCDDAAPGPAFVVRDTVQALGFRAFAVLLPNGNMEVDRRSAFTGTLYVAAKSPEHAQLWFDRIPNCSSGQDGMVFSDGEGECRYTFHW